MIYRNKTEAPTEPGYYYVRDTYAPEGSIYPAKIDICHDKLGVYCAGSCWSLEGFDFFGPVSQVKEG